MNGTKYFVNNIVFVEVNEITKMPKFGLVLVRNHSIYLADDDTILIGYNHLEALNYCSYRQSYVVKKTVKQNFINLNNLEHHYPLDLYEHGNEPEYLIDLKYSVFKLYNL